jgi:hypothetical protein
MSKLVLCLGRATPEGLEPVAVIDNPTVTNAAADYVRRQATKVAVNEPDRSRRMLRIAEAQYLNRELAII